MEDGRLVLLGRAKDMIIRGETNIYPELFEPIIERIRGVRRCALVGQYRVHLADECVVLVVEPESGVDADELRRRLRHELRFGDHRIDDAAQPDFIFTMSLPEVGRASKVDKAASTWFGRSRMRVAVTGASGFVGGSVARFLVRRGHDVIAIGRRPASDYCSRSQYVQWDVRYGPIALPDVDGVVHCAAHVGQWGAERDYRAVNVDGTRSVLETFRRAPRFVHVSTASVYSTDQPRVKVREDARVGEPLLTAYARTKAEAERVDRTVAPRLSCGRTSCTVPAMPRCCRACSLRDTVACSHFQGMVETGSQ